MQIGSGSRKPHEGLACVMTMGLVAGVWAAPLSAQEQANAAADSTPATLDTAAPAVELDSLHIRSLRENDKVFAVPRSVSTVTSEQIDRRIVRNTADLLEETEGVYSAMSERDPGLSVNIRGVQDYGRVNMNIDGARQNYSQMGHQQRNGVIHVDPQLLGGIDILKGSSSGQGGAGMSGGMATFRTLTVDDVLLPGDELGGRLRASHGIGRLGNGMHFNGSTAFGVRTDVWDGLVVHSERHLGEFRAGRNQTDELGDLLDFFDPEPGQQWLKDQAEYTDTVQRSYLTKFGLNLPNDQRLQLSRINTRIGYNDSTWDVNKSTKAGKTLYELRGRNQVDSTTTALDYSLNPDNDLIDLKGKVYYTHITNFQDNAARGDFAASANHFRTQTTGLQLENTSRFLLGGWGELSYNYGGELVRDRFEPRNFGDLEGQADKPYVDGLNARGERILGSLFNNLTWNYQDWLIATAGLRYDHYQMQGVAGYSFRGGVDGEYGGARILTQTYEIDRNEGRFSPTFGIAVKPGLDWLQLYSNYGRAWRPPSVSEVFSSGRPHAGGFQRVYPNPILKPERSRDWEVGLNIIKDSFLLADDRLTAKVAYFNTRIDDFSFMNMGLEVPGSTSRWTTQRLAYVNNVNTTLFRGLDYKLAYDTGRHYADLTYTHMIGTNKFCSPVAWMGGALKMQTDDYIVADAQNSAGKPFKYKSYKYRLDPAVNKQVTCGGIIGASSYTPADKGSLTLGTRALNHKLDMGVRLRYSRGNSNSYANANYNTIDQSLWPRYKVYDAYISYWPSKNINVGLLVDNLTDVAYIPAMADLNNQTLARGRTVTGSMEYRF